MVYYTYDANGNQISKKVGTSPAETCEYDLFGRQTKEKTTTYGYDPNGLRVLKGSQEFIWDNGNIVYDGVAWYLYGIGRIKSSGGDWYLYNAHGDVIGLTDNNGNVTKTYSYDAFGVEKNIVANDENPWRYCGEYYDKESGNIYLRARYYNPNIGRFTQQDGWEYGDKNDPLSLNLYTYCHNNPVVYSDPSGESIILTCIIVGVIIGVVAGATAGVVISYKKYEQVKWQYVVIGAVGGAAVGAAIGTGVGAIIQAIGITVTGTVGTGLYKTLEQGVNFTKTTLERMTDSNRFVPVQTLVSAIKNGVAKPDPQGTSAIMYYIDMVKNGKDYVLEVLYDKATNTILHFAYK